MTREQLKAIMKFQLTNFNDEEVDITDATIHNTVLGEDDGLGHVNSAEIYRNVIKYTLKKQGHPLKDWPENWLDMNVEDLSVKLI